MSDLDTFRKLTERLVKRDGAVRAKKKRRPQTGVSPSALTAIDVWSLVLNLPDGRDLEIKYCDAIDDDWEVIIWEGCSAEIIFSKRRDKTHVAPVDGVLRAIELLQRLMVLDELADV